MLYNIRLKYMELEETQPRYLTLSSQTLSIHVRWNNTLELFDGLG